MFQSLIKYVVHCICDSLIRIEFCSRVCHYYTELDCVVLHGTTQPPSREATPDSPPTTTTGDHVDTLALAMLTELSLTDQQYPRQSTSRRLVSIYCRDPSPQRTGACGDIDAGADFVTGADIGAENVSDTDIDGDMFTAINAFADNDSGVEIEGNAENDGSAEKDGIAENEGGAANLVNCATAATDDDDDDAAADDDDSYCTCLTDTGVHGPDCMENHRVPRGSHGNDGLLLETDTACHSCGESSNGYFDLLPVSCVRNGDYV
jgi:hypothetical protein